VDGEDKSGKKCDQCGGGLYQRDDDAPVAVKKRIEVYNAETSPVLEFYRERGVLIDIPGDNPVDEVNKLVMTALGF
jgi:adenylate kinase